MLHSQEEIAAACVSYANRKRILSISTKSHRKSRYDQSGSRYSTYTPPLHASPLVSPLNIARRPPRNQSLRRKLYLYDRDKAHYEFTNFSRHNV
ncbi:hypothetical protein BDV98DRAFT_563876 [Pterulicium gracile]|uniref:Uncharacterized protein n=1 Tax=Pterulicium gracile TaxID=1884261 RepID=A0A5C3QSG3_9AGAR|nr:hypothetical protein BDV98DRAFT_563876 [Pterula gracilis]